VIINTTKYFSETITKKERIIAFLECIKKNYSEPFMGDAPEGARLITLFGDKKAVFYFFTTGEEDGIQGDFDQLVALNFSDPVSFDWFSRIWSENFPHLYTENDKPQCSECFELNEQYKKAVREHDIIEATKIKDTKETHLEQAKAVFSLTKTIQLNSKIYKDQAS